MKKILCLTLFIQILMHANAETPYPNPNLNGHNLSPKMNMSLEDFVRQHSEKIEPLSKTAQLAWWNLATTGDAVYADRLTETNITLKKLYSSPEEYRFLLAHQDTSNPALRRQALILLHSYMENQISTEIIEEIVNFETEIESTYTNFRAKANDKVLSNNEVKEILTHSRISEERRAVWEASKKIGEEVEERVLKLITLRNQSAKEAGFSNFYSMSLELQEIDEGELFALLDKVEALTTPTWQKYKSELDSALAQNFLISVSDLMPWHYQDPFFQEAPQQAVNFDAFYKGKEIVEMSRQFYQAIGLPVEDILARSDLYERANKNQHAFCTSIDRLQDIRILCNIRDDEYWMGTQLHELGHAVYDKNIDQTLPYFLRTVPHTSTTEAIAMLFGRWSKHPDFLEHYCQVDHKEIQKILPQVQKQTAADLLVFARWALVMVHFERAMYQRPNENLNTLWWEYVERFQGITAPPHRRQKPDWAAKLHLACAPVYYQNYLLGEMTASQLKNFLEKNVAAEKHSFYNSRLVGKMLTERLFTLGARYPWNQCVERATNESLNPRYFTNDISEHIHS